jgi:hypothetical protein
LRALRITQNKRLRYGTSAVRSHYPERTAWLCPLLAEAVSKRVKTHKIG